MERKRLAFEVEQHKQSPKKLREQALSEFAYQSSINEEQTPTVMYSLHRDLIPAREEDITPFAKNLSSKANKRRFKKHASVFKEWHEDTD
jgi:hypothetical protein